MCGRYSLATTPAQLRERFAVGDAAPTQPRFNIAPGSRVIAVNTDRDGTPRGELLRWGLVPAWAKDPSVGFKMINARAETLSERPAYRAPFARMRCLVPADGFYEWQAREGAPKQPFHITCADHRLFAFAGLWSVWHRGEEDELRTLTIITTAANPLMATVHARMPVILDRDAEALWLDPAATPAALRELLHGLSAEDTALRPVGTAVNNARFDGPQCLADPLPAVPVDTPAVTPAGTPPDQGSLFKIG